MQVTNLGDCGFRIIREGQCIFASEVRDEYCLWSDATLLAGLWLSLEIISQSFADCHGLLASIERTGSQQGALIGMYATQPGHQ